MVTWGGNANLFETVYGCFHWLADGRDAVPKGTRFLLFGEGEFDWEAHQLVSVADWGFEVNPWDHFF